MLPYELPINIACEIKKIIVRDVFGEFNVIRPASQSKTGQWQQWSMFDHADSGATAPIGNLFYLAPAILKIREEEPLEQVNFLRDEMANMVWAVKSTVPSQAGKGVSGKEMALRDEATTPFVSEPGVQFRYVLEKLFQKTGSLSFRCIRTEGLPKFNSNELHCPTQKGSGCCPHREGGALLRE